MIALRKSALALVGLGALAATSAGIGAPAPKPPAPQKPAPPTAQRFYAPVYQKERYDSVLSVNDHCPVKHGRLSLNIRPTYINRQPVGFC
jgi:hypothetical protein